MAFKDKLRELLNEKDMKPADLAKQTGISEAVLSNYLNGKREPMGNMCLTIAGALNVSVDELLDSPYADAMRQSKQNPAAIGDDGMTEEERALQNTFIGLSDEKKKALLQYARFLGNEKN